MTRSQPAGDGTGETQGAGVTPEHGEQKAPVSKRVPNSRIAIIDIPAPCDFINSNQRLHRMAQAKLTKTWRQASATAAHGLKPFTQRVHITAHIHKPRGGRWDPNNLWPTIKAAVDGLVDAGLLTDDDYKHVVGPDMRQGGKGEARIIIEITEEP